MAFALYANALANPFIADDLMVITPNPTVTRPSLASLAKLWVTDFQQGIDEQGRIVLSNEMAAGGTVYRPVTMLTFWLNGALTGVSPIAFRIVNVVLHGAAACAVAILVASWGGAAAGFAAGLVAVAHPSGTDVVNRIVGRADILALLAIAAFLVVQRRGQRAGWTWRRTFAAGAWTAVALGAKESGVIVVPLAAAQAFLGRDDGRSARGATSRHGEVRVWIAVALVLAAYAAGRVAATGMKTFRYDPAWDLLQNPLLGRPLVERLPAAAALALDYMRMLVVPWPLVAFDAADGVPAWSDRAPWIGAAMLTAVAAVTIVKTWRRDAVALAGWWWLLAFAVVAQVAVPLVDYRQVRFVYAMVPALAVVAGFGYARATAASARARLAGATVGIAALAAACVLVVARNRDFTSLRTITEADLRARPDNAAMLLRLANLDAEEGRTDAAETELARVTEIAPWSSEAWHDRGYAYERVGRTDLAERCYRRALELNPSHYVAAMRLGTIAMNSGHFDEADRLLNAALRVAPDDPYVNYNLAALDTQRGRVDAAIARLRTLVARYPGLAIARDGLRMLEGDSP